MVEEEHTGSVADQDRAAAPFVRHTNAILVAAVRATRTDCNQTCPYAPRTTRCMQLDPDLRRTNGCPT
eukprot:2726631-Prymnesium_polylepis.1